MKFSTLAAIAAVILGIGFVVTIALGNVSNTKRKWKFWPEKSENFREKSFPGGGDMYGTQNKCFNPSWKIFSVFFETLEKFSEFKEKFDNNMKSKNFIKF